MTCIVFHHRSARLSVNRLTKVTEHKNKFASHELVVHMCVNTPGKTFVYRWIVVFESFLFVQCFFFNACFVKCHSNFSGRGCIFLFYDIIRELLHFLNTYL